MRGRYETRLLAFVVTSAVALGACTTNGAVGRDTSAAERAVSDTSRPAEHRERDDSRKPVEILSLAGIGAGGAVAELAAGSGYYTALLSRLVGPEGRVYAVDPAPIFEEFPNARQTFQKYKASDPRGNVSYSISRMDELAFPEALDAVFMVLYYHDTIWTGEDRTEMNRRIYAALKPGGRFVVVDHHARKGAGDSVTKQLHRMDATPVIPEISEAGFRLIENSDLLRHPADPRTESVFSESIRGRTDRFVYVFEKPGGA